MSSRIHKDEGKFAKADSVFVSRAAYTLTKQHRKLCLEAVDLIIYTIDQFDRSDFQIYSALESHHTCSVKREDIQDTLEVVCSFEDDIFDKSLVHAWLYIETFRTHFQQQIQLEWKMRYHFFVSLRASQAISKTKRRL